MVLEGVLELSEADLPDQFPPQAQVAELADLLTCVVLDHGQPPGGAETGRGERDPCNPFPGSRPAIRPWLCRADSPFA